MAACESLQTNPGPILVTIAMTVVTVGWVAFWLFTAAAVFHNTQGNSGQDQLVFFFLLVSLYWTGETLSNISHVTTAGTVASW